MLCRWTFCIDVIATIFVVKQHSSFLDEHVFCFDVLNFLYFIWLVCEADFLYSRFSLCWLHYVFFTKKVFFFHSVLLKLKTLDPCIVPQSHLLLLLAPQKCVFYSLMFFMMSVFVSLHCLSLLFVIIIRTIGTLFFLSVVGNVCVCRFKVCLHCICLFLRSFICCVLIVGRQFIQLVLQWFNIFCI